MKNPTFILYILTVYSIINIGLSFNCANIQEEQLCSDSEGCTYVTNSCTGQIKAPDQCNNAGKCLFVDPLYSGPTPDGSLDKPYPNITQAIEAPSSDVTQAVDIFGFRRKYDDEFYMTRNTDYYNVQKSFNLQPLQANNKLKIKVSASVPQHYKFLRLGQISQHIKLGFIKIIFDIQVQFDLPESGLFATYGFEFLLGSQSIASINFEESQISFPPQINVKKTTIRFINDEAHIKLINLKDKINHIPIPYISFLPKGGVEFINCEIQDSFGIDLYNEFVADSFKMVNVSFSNIQFQDSYWKLKSKAVLLENISFYNITPTFTTEVRRQDYLTFLDLESNTATLTNITIKNSNLSKSQFFRSFNGQITISGLKVSNISTIYSILEFLTSQATISESEFKYLYYPQSQKNNIANVNKLPIPQLSIGHPPLCINATAQSSLTISNSLFTNITSTCIHRDQTLTIIKESNFSNQNMELFIQSDQLDLTQNSVTWIYSQREHAIRIENSKIETNYLKPERGGALIVESNIVCSIFQVNFTNLTASRGGVAYLRQLNTASFYGCNFIDNQASLTGGIIHADESNLIIQSSTSNNCFSNHRGSLVYAKSYEYTTSQYLILSSFTINLSKEGPIEQFFLSSYNETRCDYIHIDLPPSRQISKSDILYKQIRNYALIQNDQFDQINRYIMNVSSYMSENRNDWTPRYLKISLYELDYIQYQIQNNAYFTEVAEKISNGEESSALKFLSSYRLLLEGENQAIPQDFKLITKNGFTLKVLIVFEIFDQYDNVITSELENDGLEVNLINQDSSQQQPYIQGQKQLFFSNEKVVLTPTIQFITQTIENKQSKYDVTFTQIQNDKTVLQDYPFKISFKIPIEFEDCTIGEEYIQSTKTCRPCLKNLYSFADPLSTVCQNCQENSNCIGSSHILPEQGYWRFEKYSPQTAKCPYPNDCIGGYKLNQDNTTSFHENGFCKFPSTGNLCNQCLEGYARASPQSSCVNCSQDVSGYIYFACMLTFQIILILLITITSIKFNVEKNKKLLKAESEEANYSPDQRELKEKSKGNVYQLSQIIKIAFNYSETIRIINQYSIEKLQLFIPGLISGLASSIPSQDSAFSISCLIELFESDKSKHYWIKYIAILLKPIILFILLLIIFQLYFMAKEAKKRKKNQSKIEAQQLDNQRQSIWKVGFNSIKKYFVTMIIVILYFNQSHIIVATLDLFDCQDQHPQGDPKYFLFYNSNIECWVGTHRTIVFFIGIPILVIFGVLLPLFAYLKLKKTMKYENNSSNQVEQQKISVGQWLRVILVKDSVQEKNYFWEILILLRKTIIILTFVILRRFDYLESVTIALLVMIIFTFIHYQRNPYKFQNLNHLEFVGYCSICLLLMALIVITGSKSDVKFSSYILDAGFVFTSVSFAVVAFYKIINLTLVVFKESKQLKKMEIQVKLRKRQPSQHDDKAEVAQPDISIKNTKNRLSIHRNEVDLGPITQTEQSLLDEESPSKKINLFTSCKMDTQINAQTITIAEDKSIDQSKQEANEDQDVEQKTQNFYMLSSSPRKLRLTQEESSPMPTPLNSQRAFFSVTEEQNELPQIKRRKQKSIVEMITREQESQEIPQIEFSLSDEDDGEGIRSISSIRDSHSEERGDSDEKNSNKKELKI